MAAAITNAFAQLRDGSWFDRSRVRAATAILLAVELALFAFLVAGTNGLIVPLGKATTTDFVSFYAAGTLADAGTPALAYDQAAHHAAEQRAAQPGIEYQFFNYPPVYLLLCVVFAQLPYLVAFVLFEAATLALFLSVGLRILGERGGTALVALAALPIVFWNFGLGQNAFLTAGLFGAATLLIDRRPVLAGLLFGALCYKPQFGILIPLALAAGGHWRAFAGAAASALALIAASVAAFGVETWQAFAHTAGSSPAMYQSGRILFAGMANPFGAARVLGADLPLAYAVQAVATLTAAALVVVAWGRRLSLPTRAAVLAAAAVIAAPLALLYDLMLAAVAGCWLVRDRDAPAAWTPQATAIAAAYVLALLGRGVGEQLHIPVFAIAGLAIFGLAAGRVRRELALRRGAAAPLRAAAPRGDLDNRREIASLRPR